MSSSASNVSARRVVLPGVEVRPPERLEDRRLAGLELRRPLEDDRGLRVVAPLEEALAALAAAHTADSASSRGIRRRGRGPRSRPILARIVRDRRYEAVSPASTDPWRPEPT